MQYQIFPKKF